MNDYDEPVTVDSDTTDLGLAQGDGDPITAMLQSLLNGGGGPSDFDPTPEQERYESLVDRVNQVQDYLENDDHEFGVTFTSQELFWLNNAIGWFLSTCVLGNPAHGSDNTANVLLDVAERVLGIVTAHEHDAVTV